MDKYIFQILTGCLLLSYPFSMTAQTSPNDSISRTVALDEVTVVASNVIRVDDHLVIYPNTQQKKSANSGYGVLKRLMKPGMIVDTQSDKALGIEETPVNYGLECTYSKGNFFAEVNIVSPFTDRKFRKSFRHELYAYLSDEDFRTSSRYCHIKLTYTFDFGRQTKKVRREVDKTINSSLLKSF